MADHTSHYNLTKPSYGEITDVSDINRNMDALDAIIYDADQYAQSRVSDAYDDTKSYAVGDFCIHENQLYKCITATTGTWDSTAWALTNIAQAFEPKHTWRLFETITADGVATRYDRDLPVNCTAIFIEVYGKTGTANDAVHVYASFPDNVWRRVGVVTAGINTAGDRYSQFWYTSDGNYWQGQQANPAAANQEMALQVRQNGYLFTSDPIKKLRINTDTNPFPSGSTITIYVRR